MPRIDEFINNRLGGCSASDILDSYEEATKPDFNHIRSQLIADCRRQCILLTNEDVQSNNDVVVVCLNEGVTSSCKQDLMTIVDTYSRIYPEYDFVIES